jgi:hypothetical protein
VEYQCPAGFAVEDFLKAEHRFLSSVNLEIVRLNCLAIDDDRLVGFVFFEYDSRMSRNSP